MFDSLVENGQSVPPMLAAPPLAITAEALSCCYWKMVCMACIWQPVCCNGEWGGIVLSDCHKKFRALAFTTALGGIGLHQSGFLVQVATLINRKFVLGHFIRGFTTILLRRPRWPVPAAHRKFPTSCCQVGIRHKALIRFYQITFWQVSAAVFIPQTIYHYRHLLLGRLSSRRWWIEIGGSIHLAYSVGHRAFLSQIP